MSLFKYGDLEREIDFTDVEFLENLDEAKKLIKKEAAQVPKVGKTADIIRAQCQCYVRWEYLSERVLECYRCTIGF